MERIKCGDLVSVNWSGDTWIAESRCGNMWVITNPQSGFQMLVERRQLQKVVEKK
jgi:hypothetical protein